MIRDYLVRGDLEGSPVTIGILDRSADQARLTVRELWPMVRIASVVQRDDWDDTTQRG